MTNFHLIRKWSEEQLIGRLRVLNAVLNEGLVQGEEREVFLDEVVVILLEVLSKAMRSMDSVHRFTPMELFEGVYSPVTGDPMAEVIARFKTTKAYVEVYKFGDNEIKEGLRPILAARGLL